MSSFFVVKITERGNMGTKGKNELVIGLDTIELDITTEFELIENNHEFISPKTNEVIGILKHKQGRHHGYRLNVCLPKCLRKTNVIPLSIIDVVHLMEIVTMIEKQMKELFGESYPELIVSTAEVNCTATLQNKQNVQPMLNMLAHMMLEKDSKLCIWCSGKQSGERYKAVHTLKSGMQVESIKTQQLSNSRMSLKVYDKGKEQNIENAGIIRFESIYCRHGLDYARTGRTLADFLTAESLRNLLGVYRRDFKTYFIDRFWNVSGAIPFYQECITIIYNDLVRLKGQPTTVALMNRNIIEWDFDLFKKACKRYYDNPDSSRQAIYRVRKSGEIEIHENVINDFCDISKAIING